MGTAQNRHGGMILASMLLTLFSAVLVSIVLGTLKGVGELTISWWVVLTPVIAVTALFIGLSVVVIVSTVILVFTRVAVHQCRSWLHW